MIFLPAPLNTYKYDKTKTKKKKKLHTTLFIRCKLCQVSAGYYRNRNLVLQQEPLQPIRCEHISVTDRKKDIYIFLTSTWFLLTPTVTLTLKTKPRVCTIITGLLKCAHGIRFPTSPIAAATLLVSTDEVKEHTDASSFHCLGRHTKSWIRIGVFSAPARPFLPPTAFRSDRNLRDSKSVSADERWPGCPSGGLGKAKKRSNIWLLRYKVDRTFLIIQKCAKK